jgi:hypothetical protein
MSPESYLGQVMALTQGSGGRLAYTGKNWLAGRKF